MSLRNAILGFLTIRPLSGYDIKRYFDASVRHFWSADQAAIYRALADLEAESLVGHERVEQQTRPDRKVFHITQAGTAVLDAWLRLPAPPVVRREPLLLKLFFASRLTPPEFDAILGAELQAVESELTGFREIIGAIEHDAAEVQRTAGPEAAAAHQQLLVGPLVTLTNGVQLGLSYRDWLRELRSARERDALTAPALLERLRMMTSA
jgi:PadR family transcriptional regulator, regulatory protein AphA